MSKPIMLTSFMDGPCSVGCPTRQLWHIDAVKRGPSTHHCERGEAIQSQRHLCWIASSAMPPRNDGAERDSIYSARAHLARPVAGGDKEFTYAASATRSSGSLIRTVVPASGALSISRRPPCSSTSALA